MYGERQTSADDSNAAFAVLEPEDTMSSMVDLSLGPERYVKCRNLLPSFIYSTDINTVWTL